MSDDRDDINQLYNRFKEEISNPSNEIYFDGDDLLMIFDIAGDYVDRCTQMYVLKIGARLYPNSEDLELRLGIFLLEIEDDVVVDDFFERNKKRKGLLWDILRLRYIMPPADLLKTHLDQLLKAYRFEEDEEIIQFIRLVIDGNCKDWLARNYKRFVDRCHYKDTAITECAEAIGVDDKELCISMYEELTKIDPFNVDAWRSLSGAYVELGNYDEALNAISYAQALSPDDDVLKYIEAEQLYHKDPSGSSSLAILEKMHSDGSTLMSVENLLSVIYVSRNETDKAIALWQNILAANPFSDNAIVHLLMLGVDPDQIKIPETLRTPDNEEIATEQVKLLLADGDEKSLARALELMEAIDKLCGLSALVGDYLRLAYRFGKYHDICNFCERNEQKLDVTLLPYYAASLLRTAQYDRAAAIATASLLRVSQECTDIDKKMAHAGLKIVLNTILESAISRDFDPTTDPISLVL